MQYKHYIFEIGPYLYTPWLWVKKRLCCSYPELLDQVHIGSLVLLHAALRDAGHVSSQRAVNQNTQHVQHCGEELTVGETQT